MITPLMLSIAANVANTFLAITARHNIFDTITHTIWHYNALLILPSILLTCRVEYFLHFYAQI